MNNRADLRIFGDIEIPGLNITDGLERLDYDENAYLEILRSYVSHIAKFTEVARKETAGNLREYCIAIHGLKGSCRGIGAETLGDRAELLEKAAKSGNIALIKDTTGALLESVEDFRAGLAGFIENIDAQAKKDKPEIEKPDPELIKKVIEAAENYDIDALRAAIKVLETCTYRCKPGIAE